MTRADLSGAQDILAKFDAGNLVVEAVPGAGKTSVIVRRLEHLVESGVAPERILALTFSRRAVRELRERIARSLPGVSGRMDVRTFHGFASRLLGIDHPGFTSGRLVERPVAELVLREAFSSTPARGFSVRVLRSPSFVRDAERYVTDLQRAGESTRAELALDGSDRLRDLIAVSERLSQLRRDLGIADYDDLVARAAALAADPSSRVHAWLHDRYEHVLVDEFQDTDPQQVRLVEALDARVFAVGDPAQAIYGFRGAARDAIEQAVQTLHMHRERLDTSRRCPQAICDVVNAIPGLPPAQRMTTAVEHAGSATVSVAATPLDEAALVADRVAAAREAGVPPSEIAVLLRSLEPLGSFVRAEIERRGIRVAMSGGDAIVQEPVVRTLLDALRAIAEPSQLDRWADLFASPVLGYPRLRAFRALHAARPDSIDAACDVLQASGPGRVGAATVRQTLSSARAAWESGDVERAAHAIAIGLDLLGAAIDAGDAAARRAGRRLRRTLEAIEDIAGAQRRFGRGGNADEVLSALLEHSAQWPDEAGESSSADVDAVRVLTIHASKGLEFDTVILADAADGHLPVELRREGILDESDLALSRKRGCDLGATPAEHVEEERSLFYVAATRSKRELIVTFSAHGVDGTPQAPSRFLPLLERDRLAEDPPYRAPLMFDGAAKLPPALEPRPVTLPQRIGVTRVDDWFSCPRKFFYSAVVRLPSERAFTMTFGILVHTTLERFHQEHHRVDGDSNAAAWTERMRAIRRDVWLDSGFDWKLESDAAGASADRMLETYVAESIARGRERPYTVESIERRVEVDVNGNAMIGKLDRMDRFDDGSSRIVDYKTGRLYNELEGGLEKLVDAVANDKLYGEVTPKIASVQLPLYRRALGGDPEIELIYLRGKDGGGIAFDGLARSGEAELLLRVDDAVRIGFTDAVSQPHAMQRTTGDLRICQQCNFYTVCDGALEAVDAQE